MYGKTQWIALLACVLAPSVTFAALESYELAWSRRIGTSTSDDRGNAVAVGPSDEVYIAGETEGSLAAPNAGYDDAFLAKYTRSGDLLWSRQFGTSGADVSRSVAVGAAGSAYICGYGDSGHTAYLTKYDGSGNLLWLRQFGSSRLDRPRSVAVDAGGNAYVSGYTTGSLAAPNAGRQDAFVVKYDSSGHHLWSRQLGTPSKDKSHAVGVDAAGNAYIAGTTAGSLAGDIYGKYDAFLAKYDPSGELLWKRQFGSASLDFGNAVAVGPHGNAYVSGGTWGFVGDYRWEEDDAFLVKYSTSGHLLWKRQIGTTERDGSSGVALDDAGNAYITGFTDGVLPATGADGGGAFLLKYTPSGDLVSLDQTGELSDSSVAVDSHAHGYLTGYAGPLGPGRDAVLVKYVPEPASLSLLALGGLGLLRRRPGEGVRRENKRR